MEVDETLVGGVEKGGKRGRGTSKEVVVEEVEEKWFDDTYTVDPAVVAERAAFRYGSRTAVSPSSFAIPEGKTSMQYLRELCVAPRFRRDQRVVGIVAVV